MTPVLTLTRQLSVDELDLFGFPQNTWGGENMLIYLLSAVLGLAVHNPCDPHVESVGHLAAAVPPLPLQSRLPLSPHQVRDPARGAPPL